MLFYLKFYLHGSLGWHERTGVCWSYVGQSDVETYVYESWNWMRLNLIHDGVLVACKTTTETIDEVKFYHRSRKLILLFWKPTAEIKMERSCKNTKQKMLQVIVETIRSHNLQVLQTEVQFLPCEWMCWSQAWKEIIGLPAINVCR